jgi:hypothetical protein
MLTTPLTKVRPRFRSRWRGGDYAGALDRVVKPSWGGIAAQPSSFLWPCSI